MNPFCWLEDATVSIAAGATSLNVALKKMPTGTAQVRIKNDSTSTIFIRGGANSSVAATATDLPIGAGVTEVLTLNNSPSAPTTFIAAISPSGSGTIYFTTGAGI